MSELIERFKKEHCEIIALLREIKKLGIHSKEGQAKLMSAKGILLEHLKHEDEQLYPALREEAEQNKNLKRELELFAMDPEYVSRVVAEFFDTYSEGVTSKDFSINFESLFASLNARITHEEEALYQEYEMIGEKE